MGVDIRIKRNFRKKYPQIFNFLLLTFPLTFRQNVFRYLICIRTTRGILTKKPVITNNLATLQSSFNLLYRNK